MTDQLKAINDPHCENPPATYDDLKVLMLNCTLTRSPHLSHTEGLLKVAEQIYQAKGVTTEIVRPVDFEMAAGPENDFTNRNTTFLVWNTLHTARWLKDAGGFPAHGNRPEDWDAGCHTDFHSPEHKR